MMRQVSIDFLPNMLGIIDGDVDFPFRVKLVDESTNQVFDDVLQDFFLSLIEEEDGRPGRA